MPRSRRLPHNPGFELSPVNSPDGWTRNLQSSAHNGGFVGITDEPSRDYCNVAHSGVQL